VSIGLSQSNFIQMNIIDHATKGCIVLAPLTKGGNLPFRRFCVETFGAQVTVSEMAYARYLVKGDSRERALLRKHASEKCFGVQLAALQPEEALEAAKIACGSGADFIDINCGCPIDDVVRRGLGSALLRRPKALFRLVEHLANNIEVPITVKIRLGFKEGQENALEIAKGVELAGAKVLTIHGRTREQRYARSANWQLIGEVASQLKIPVIGNGDILTYYEAEQKMAVSGLRSVMLARGALIKPWIFQELRERRTLNPSSRERVRYLMLFSRYLREHFGSDELGKKRIMKFLPWHLELFARYQYLPEESYLEASRQYPLLQSRQTLLNTSEDSLSAVLQSTDINLHQKIAVLLIAEEDEDRVCAQMSEWGEALVGALEQPEALCEYREVAG
jgi:tRNA-dihydrouridine synthase 3